MARRCRKAESSSSDESDSSGSETSDSNKYDADSTEIGNDDDQQKDAGDVAQLFADNEHSSEYYMQQLEQFDETSFSKEDYSRSTVVLLDGIEQKWFRYGVHPAPRNFNALNGLQIEC